MKRRLKYILPPGIVVVAIALTFLVIKNRRAVVPEAREVMVPLVRVIDVKPGEHRFTVRAQGTVTPRTEINIVSEVAGRVVEVASSFVTGGFFQAGEVLLTVDPRDYELAVTRAAAALAEAQVRVQREEAEATMARKEWETLGQGGAPNPLLLREPQLAEARAGVEAARAASMQATLDLERCRIRAPFAGRVWNKKADIGQFLARGEIVARIYSVDYAEVRLPLPLDQMTYLDLPLDYRGESRTVAGPSVRLESRFGTSTHAWTGRVVRVEGEIDPRTRMLMAVVRVADPYGRPEGSQRPPMAVGLFVQAEIEGTTAGPVLVVPRAAMHNDRQLTVIDRDNRLQFRDVNVVRLEHDRVVVRSELSEGDKVCISRLDAPVEGMKVRTTTTNAPAGHDLSASAAADE